MSDGAWLTWEDFLQPGTPDVPRNRFGITDFAGCSRVERIYSAMRLIELELSPVAGDFDMAHLQSIHRYVFQDVHDWAGIIRPFTLVKGGDEFCRPQFIESYAADIFGRLQADGLLHGLDVDQFAAKAGDLLADVNALHAFREGNGRTQRAFLSQLAAQAGHRLVWPAGAEKRNIEASRAAAVAQDCDDGEDGHEHSAGFDDAPSKAGSREEGESGDDYHCSQNKPSDPVIIGRNGYRTSCVASSISRVDHEREHGFEIDRPVGRRKPELGAGRSGQDEREPKRGNAWDRYLDPPRGCHPDSRCLGPAMK